MFCRRCFGRECRGETCEMALQRVVSLPPLPPHSRASATGSLRSHHREGRNREGPRSASCLAPILTFNRFITCRSRTWTFPQPSPSAGCQLLPLPLLLLMLALMLLMFGLLALLSSAATATVSTAHDTPSGGCSERGGCCRGGGGGSTVVSTTRNLMRFPTPSSRGEDGRIARQLRS